MNTQAVEAMADELRAQFSAPSGRETCWEDLNEHARSVWFGKALRLARAYERGRATERGEQANDPRLVDS
jgi:hypothetical protein